MVVKSVAVLVVIPLLFTSVSFSGGESDYEVSVIGFESEGMLLKGLLFVPEGANGAPAVIVLHGFGGMKDLYCSRPYAADYYGGHYGLAEELCSRGFVVLVYDQRGTGETGGDINLKLMVKDVPRAVTFLQQRPEVDDERIGLMGHSLGGMLAGIAAGMDERIKATTLWAAPASIEISIETMVGGIIPIIGQTIGEVLYSFIDMVVTDLPAYPLVLFSETVAKISYPLFASFAVQVSYGIKFSPNGFDILVGHCESPVPAYLGMFQDGKELRTEDYVGRIAPRPLLIVHGTEDTTVYPKNSEILYENAGEPTTLVWVENTNHMFKEPEWKGDEVVRLTAEWFVENL